MNAPPQTANPYPWVTPGCKPLGALVGPESTIFRVFAHADRMIVRLVHPGTLAFIEAEMAPDYSDPGVWEAEVSGDLRGWTYSFTMARGREILADIVDPWARLVRWGRGVVFQDGTPVTSRPAMEPCDAVIYEMHVRDFTRHPSSGVRHDWRGRYLGITQRGTRYNGTSATTGLDHLLELGVNVVQLMPVHSFSLPYHPEYEWGYMPMDYNAPHEGYAAGVELDAPIREFKRLVSTLHDNRVRVTLDVVYNHTFERFAGTPGADTDGRPAPARLRSFMALAPMEYFRFGADGAPSNGSACGNEFRSDSPMGRRFIVESVKYWVHEFGIDGFRFDLMGLIDRETMSIIADELHRIDPSIMVYGEPWAGGPTPIEVNAKGKQRSRGWGVFNDDLRDALRGDVFKPKMPGFLAAGESCEPKVIDAVKAGIGGAVTSFADSPGETINYIECHDNHTLSDRLGLSTAERKGVTVADRMKMNRLGALMLLTSQGTPFIHSGQELGRGKQGLDNTYNLGDEVNNIPWALKEQNHRLFDYYRALIRMRREHPMFRLRTKESIAAAVRFVDGLPAGVVGYTLDDPTGADPWRRAALFFNGGGKTVTAALPPGAWRAVIEDGHFVSLAPEKRAVATGKIEIGPHAGSVLYQER